MVVIKHAVKTTLVKELFLTVNILLKKEGWFEDMDGFPNFSIDS